MKMSSISSIAGIRMCNIGVNPVNHMKMKATFLGVMLLATIFDRTATYTMLRATRLDDINFETRTDLCDASNCNWFILFHVPWCEYCKELVPVWDRLAEELKGELMVGRVDIEENTRLKHRFRHRVKAFPTMLYISGDGQMYVYTGTRDINHLKDFARREWANVQEGARSSLPPALESMPLWQRFIVEPVEDMILAIIAGYEGIWARYRSELLCAISVSFSVGCYLGFLIRGAIDASLPLPAAPPRAAPAKPKRQ